MKEKWKHAYMDTAKRFADLSYAKRLKVGAIVVKDNRIISIGYNGTPAGWSNECEDPETGLTKAEVLHAEENAIVKLARDGESSKGATMFCTHAPCTNCAKLILGSGITHLVYGLKYRSSEGLTILERGGIILEELGESNST